MSHRIKLPADVWIHIFHFLTPFQLKKVRLVCTEWNRLVCDAPELLDGFVFTVPTCSSVPHTQSVSSSRYTTVKMYNLAAGIMPISSLSAIRRLVLINPCIPAGTLIQLAGSLPNLQQLWIRLYDYFNYDMYEKMPTNVQLNRLERLDLDLGVKDEFLRIFERICPKLRSFQLKVAVQKYLDAPYGWKLLSFIRSTRNTLEKVVFQGIEFRHESLLRDIMAIEGLHLKSVSLYSCAVRQEDIPHLCQWQVRVESLRLPFYLVENDLLTSLAMHLENLRALELTTGLADLLPIWSNLTRLQKLSMTYVGQQAENLNIDGYANPNLRSIALKGFFLSSTALQTFFKKSPNIRELVLVFPRSRLDLHDVLVVSGQLKDLTQFSVFPSGLACPVHYAAYSYSPFRKLRQLSFFGGFNGVPINLLLENCPYLVDLTLSACLISDNELILLSSYMKNLTKLWLDQLFMIGVSSVQKVVQQCAKLEQMIIVNCPNIYPFVPQRSTVQVLYKPCLPLRLFDINI